MATFLNIGLAVCCGGLLVWNLRQEKRSRELETALESVFAAVVAATGEGADVVVNGEGYVLTAEPNPKAIH